MPPTRDGWRHNMKRGQKVKLRIRQVLTNGEGMKGGLDLERICSRLGLLSSLVAHSSRQSSKRCTCWLLPPLSRPTNHHSLFYASTSRLYQTVNITHDGNKYSYTQVILINIISFVPNEWFHFNTRECFGNRFFFCKWCHIKFGLSSYYSI
jgi:hypothetical protein